MGYRIELEGVAHTVTEILIKIRAVEMTTCVLGEQSKKKHVSYTGCFIMFYVITNLYNKKTKGPTLVELFTATGKLNFLTTRDVQCVHHG
jgi:hypothetical protein